MAVDNDYTEIFIGNFKDSWSSTNTLLKKGRIGCWDAGSSLHYQYFAPWEQSITKIDVYFKKNYIGWPIYDWVENRYPYHFKFHISSANGAVTKSIGGDISSSY